MMLKPDTRSIEYTRRLVETEERSWKKALGVQLPYRWHLRHLNPGFMLDVGCGLGRNLGHIGGLGVGVDHNQYSIEIARTRGLIAFTPDEFFQSEFNGGERFDSILLAHTIEHMTQADALGVLRDFLPVLKRGGRLICICPQERGYASDETHIQFADFDVLRSLARQAGLTVSKEYSFPFPRVLGRFFKYNEFVLVAKKS